MKNLTQSASFHSRDKDALPKLGTKHLADWHHAYLRLRRLWAAGVWDRIMEHVVTYGEPKLAFATIDGTIVRAHQETAGARLSKPER